MQGGGWWEPGESAWGILSPSSWEQAESRSGCALLGGKQDMTGWQVLGLPGTTSLV